METEETKVGNFISNRPVRILVFGVAVIIVCVVLVGVAITALRSSRNTPMSVDIYPGAQLLKSTRGSRSDGALYSTQDSVQQVFDYYDKRLPKDEVQGCKKLYSDDNKSTQELPGHFYVVCIEDNSQLDVVQQLQITVNYQVNADTQKPETRLLIERNWGSAS